MEVDLQTILLGGLTVGIIVLCYTLFWKKKPVQPINSPPTITRKAAEKPKDTKSNGITENKSGPPLKIFFGSQTGTAEDFGKAIKNEGLKCGFNAELLDMEDFESEDLADVPLAIFVTATYGEGEPTDNAKILYDWLKEDREPDVLSKLQYTVFGLGNRTYEQYNSVGRFFDRRLEELGATRVYPKGEGDDDSNLEEEFLNWKKGLWEPLCTKYNLNHSAISVDEVTRSTFLKYWEAAPSTAKKNAVGTTQKGLSYDLKTPYIAEVATVRELHTEHSDRSCLHVEFILDDNLTYEPGDHLGVFPHNEESIVQQLADRLAIPNLDKFFSLHPTQMTKSVVTPKAVLGPCTLRTAFTELLDLTNPPRKSALLALAQYAKDDKEKHTLQILGSSDESSLSLENQYSQYIKQDRRGILDILIAFPSLSPPLDHLLELITPLTPRYYSISSSLKALPGKVSLTSVVVQFKTGAGRIHNGVCSNFFTTLIPGKSFVPLYVRKSNFRLPKDLIAPMIMVGPGTGLAPFRGFIQERKFYPSDQRGEAVLFFGCRNRNHDFLYNDELDASLSDGSLTTLINAFSREQEEKMYVQNRIAENSDLVFDILFKRAGYFYICGDAAAMAPAVRSALRTIIMDKMSNTEAEAEEVITNLQQNGRFSSDVWF